MAVNEHLQVMAKILNQKVSKDEATLPDHELGEGSLEKKRRINERNYNILIAELKIEESIRLQVITFYLQQKEHERQKIEEYRLEKEKIFNINSNHSNSELKTPEEILCNELAALKEEIKNIETEIRILKYEIKKDLEILKILYKEGLNEWNTYFSSEEVSQKFSPLRISLAIPEQYKQAAEKAGFKGYLEIDRETQIKIALNEGKNIFTDTQKNKPEAAENLNKEIEEFIIKAGQDKLDFLPAQAKEEIMNLPENIANIKHCGLEIQKNIREIVKKNHKLSKIQNKIDEKKFAIDAKREMLNGLEEKRQIAKDRFYELKKDIPNNLAEEIIKEKNISQATSLFAQKLNPQIIHDTTTTIFNEEGCSSAYKNAIAIINDIHTEADNLMNAPLEEISISSIGDFENILDDISQPKLTELAKQMANESKAPDADDNLDNRFSG